MGYFSKSDPAEDKIREVSSGKGTPAESPAAATPANNSQSSLAAQVQKNNPVDSKESSRQNRPTVIALILGAVASIGGFMFGYESGQIGGFLEMTDFLSRFGHNGVFSSVRQGTIVALLCAGTLVGCLISGWICDKIGRRYTVSASAFFYIIGVIIEITSSTFWIQFAMGRFTAGIGIGALSTSVPMYQSESVPKNIRSLVVGSYQLAITLGIWMAYMVNWFTAAAYSNSAQWRIPNGLPALWAILLGLSILFLPESPRFAYGQGRIEEARKTLARLAGLDPNDPLIDAEINEIEEKVEEERKAGAPKLSEIFTAPGMLHRTLLGMILQAGQQLTGANFFFYYSTTIFKSVGLSNSYVTSIILGTVNVVATVFGLWLINAVGRRKALIGGAFWMFGCFMVYTFVGTYMVQDHNSQNGGTILIVFTCLFICAFATTWGPLPWAIVSELYPTRYRAVCMALATASNWLLNFLISFFTSFITDKIHYWYGMVFGGSCLALVFIVYFFVIESKDRSLEEIDTMYTTGVNPIKSASWEASSSGSERIAGNGIEEQVMQVEAVRTGILVQEVRCTESKQGLKRVSV